MGSLKPTRPVLTVLVVAFALVAMSAPIVGAPAPDPAPPSLGVMPDPLPDATNAPAPPPAASPAPVGSKFEAGSAGVRPARAVDHTSVDRSSRPARTATGGRDGSQPGRKHRTTAPPPAAEPALTRLDAEHPSRALFAGAAALAALALGSASLLLLTGRLRNEPHGA